MAKDQQDFFARIEALLMGRSQNNEQRIDGVEVQTQYRLEHEGQSELLEQIISEVQDRNRSADTLESEWLDDLKLAELLHISSRTIARRRKDNTFKPFRIGGRYHYHLSDILKLKDRFMT